MSLLSGHPQGLSPALESLGLSAKEGEYPSLIWLASAGGLFICGFALIFAVQSPRPAASRPEPDTGLVASTER
jgi:hypothetical protein